MLQRIHTLLPTKTIVLNAAMETNHEKGKLVRNNISFQCSSQVSPGLLVPVVDVDHFLDCPILLRYSFVGGSMSHRMSEKGSFISKFHCLAAVS